MSLPNVHVHRTWTVEHDVQVVHDKLAIPSEQYISPISPPRLLAVCNAEALPPRSSPAKAHVCRPRCSRSRLRPLRRRRRSHLYHATHKKRPRTSSTNRRPHAFCRPPPRAAAFLGEGLGLRKPKVIQITTSPGQLGAGETETEADEPPTHLPTSRIMPVSEPLVPPSVLTMLLFESCRLLSVVPAAFGVMINVWCLWSPPDYSSIPPPDHYYQATHRTQAWGRKCPPNRGDYFIAVLWALLTAHQCLKLTTGLLHRWRAYYSPLSTLIRLLALQAICWPATHFTLDIVGSLGTNATFADDQLTLLESALLRWATARPDICWAVIGTTTCVSRSIQIWVTSNLLLSRTGSSSGSRMNMPSAVPDRLRPRVVAGEEKWKLIGRKWDWSIVVRVCILPAGCLYVVMAWIGAWRRETGGC
ncbi:hypothetical protein JVU11DRAFT_3273 [Chiua virens]|nr:hypothetical protein JVU11DRAFT_3273 [Chiua virens]